MNIDDCWAEKTRSASGDLVASVLKAMSYFLLYLICLRLDATRFPSGFNNLTSQIHDLGLYVFTCSCHRLVTKSNPRKFQESRYRE